MFGVYDIYTMRRNDIENQMDLIKEWVSENRPKNWMCKQLKCRPSTLERHLIRNSISYKGNMGERGFKIPPNKKDIGYFLQEGSLISSSKLRKKILSDGLKDARCEKCGNDRWLGERIPLDLHHIDGNRFNNSIENLQLLCKNCHGLTPNHSKKKS